MKTDPLLPETALRKLQRAFLEHERQQDLKLLTERHQHALLLNQNQRLAAVMQALRDKHVEDSVGLERKVEKLTARVAKGKA